MSDITLENRTLEVSGIPENFTDEFLTLYFENKRRSGGGPLVSLQKNGSCAVLVFEESEAAERVLAKGSHTVQNNTLFVGKKAPHDPKRLLLRGIKPCTSLEMVQLYVENMTDVDSNEYTVIRSPKGDLALITFQNPQDFQNVFVKIKMKTLDGATIHPEQVDQTDSILVQNLAPSVSDDLLKLYFESKRGGETEVKEVVMIQDGMAKLSFQDLNGVERVLGKSHKLEERDLKIQPYFDFLQTEDLPLTLSLTQTQNTVLDLAQSDSLGPAENDIEKQTQTSPVTDTHTDMPIPEQGVVEEIAKDTVADMFFSGITLPDPLKLSLFKTSNYLKDLQNSHHDYVINIVDNVVEISGPSKLGTERLKSQILEFFTGFAQAYVTLEKTKAMFLSREEVKDTILKNLRQQGLACIYSVTDCTVMVLALSLSMVEEACDIIKSSVFEFSVAVSSDIECMLYSKEWPTFMNSLELCSVTIPEKGEKIDVLTVKGMEDEKRSKIFEFLNTSIQTEVIITMEPGRLRYIQTYYDQILADMDQVSILPLESKDVSGFRIHGNCMACQAAEDLLRSIMTSIQTKTITLNQPGVARFLVHGEGVEILKEMEQKFEVHISLDKVHWEPLENEDILESAWKMMSQQNFHRNSRNQADVPVNGINAAEGGATDQNSAEECNPTTNTEDQAEDDVSVEDMLQTTTGGDDETVLGHTAQLSLDSYHDLEEDAKLCLAIQLSMENGARQAEAEDDELQKVLELSRREQGPTADFQLERAIYMSLQDAIMAANNAEILVFARYGHDLIRVDIALGKKVDVRQCKEKVEDKCFKKLCEHQTKCIDVLRRKHAVDIHIQGTTAMISGFREYVQSATSELKQLLKWISNTSSDSEILRTVQWVWHDAKSQSVPYPGNANIFIENSWQMKLKTIDIIFDNRPYMINFETMHEYSIASGKSVPIRRKLLTSGDMTIPEEEYSLLSNMSEASRVHENSNEFSDVVKNFYETIREYHNKIKIIKVEKITNNLLLSQYKLKKTSVLASSTEPVIERTLYHGTGEMSVKEICIHGFNRSFSGKNATVYGQGVYFAVNSAVSVQDQYSPPNADGHKFVFVTKVLTGDFTKGNHDMKTTPLKEGSEMPLRYHSVVDRVDSPTIFVIFNDTQAYPEYLITCQKIHG
ncbi:protein mono-ADP-ribosyltransferase PARP10 isoform X2 [Brienomyrus brachyistius]|uniref:protein mono-ADP-ribosyltransferase PARP10 isoform X2 n=1 Tax=Brienomyrus brachyistius TaxID=42636 RepID=UPI0020B3A836|nr:protein mono-ADP-ribosyltransferase PARP10 isoform X2 [Brienomyrus brachyistius]